MSKKKENSINPSDLPIEVQLVSGVKNCDACKWFWGDDRPYGPYPSYDFLERYPENVKIKYNEKAKKPIPWIKTKSNALKFIEPAVMQGCRKAPIMTIGINPNLTAFKPNATNDTWAYPKFSDQASYAYYYRYKTIYQESFSGDFLKKQMSKDEKEIVRAKKDGWLTSAQRSNTSRWLMLKIQYDDGTKETIERTWKPREDYFVNFMKNTKKNHFKKNEIIAAKLHLKKNLESSVFHNVTGYYARFVPILDGFKKLIAENGDKKQLQKMNLTIGEDIAMHDMIGCASPGWTIKYNIPTERVIENCVDENSWVIKQVIQSQPKVIVLVGGSSMSMFLRIFAPFTNLPKEKDFFDLVRKTCEKPYFMKIKVGKNFSFTSRIICSPHFSYGDNFEKHVRLSNEEWYELKNKHPKELKSILRLNKAKKIEIREGYGSTQMIMLKKGGKEYLKKIVGNFSPKPKELFLKNYFDITKMISHGLKQEFDKGNLQFDDSTGHLKRTEGPCRYCKNDSWEFPEGCEYGNADEESIPAKDYLEITEKIVKKGISHYEYEEYKKKTEYEKHKLEMYELESF